MVVAEVAALLKAMSPVKFLSALSLSLFFALVCVQNQVLAEDLNVRSSVFPQPPLTSVSPRLSWRGGLSLAAWSASFGGFSGLLVDDQGSRITALTDKADFLSASLIYDSSGVLKTVAQATVKPLSVEPSIVRFKRFDSESLTRLGDGSIIVSFERAHRFRRYPELNLNGTTLPNPVAIVHSSLNNGVEAVTDLPGNRFFAVAEKLRRQGGYRAWIFDGNKWEILVYPRDQRWQATGATTSPDGDKVWLTERRFHGFTKGFESRIVELETNTIQPGAFLKPKVLAHFGLGTDLGRNFEAISAIKRPNGETWIYLMTDNNFNPLQSTLLIAFAITR